MYYGVLVEEQWYLSPKKENESFRKLIRDKVQLSKEFEDKQQDVKDHVINTRIAGENNWFLDGRKINNRKIDIDIREFRPTLPNVLFRVVLKLYFV